MRAWLYYRLSRDEDEEMNSLQNQRQILVDYAEQNGYEIVGESFDDNVSGMTFNRKGLGELEIAVDEGKIDVVLVKDLSRLGRHRTQTELFIDHLRQNNVRVYSVTEGIDSANENDDLLIGFKQIFNDFYAKDISKKVKAGMRQKQKSKGLVLTLPLGYYLYRNTNEVKIDEDTAWIVREVFKLYVDGYGLTTIAKKMNADGIRSPDYYFNRKLADWKEYCTSHTIRENQIDELVENEVKSLRDNTLSESDKYDKLVRDWLRKKPLYEQQIQTNTDKILTLKQQIEDLIIERIGDREHGSIYNNMIAKRGEEIAALEKKITELREYDKVCKQRKKQLKNTTQILDEILSEGKISDVNLRMLVNKILIHQNEDKSLDIKFEMNGDFNTASNIPIEIENQLKSA